MTSVELSRPALIEIPVTPLAGAFTRPLASFIRDASRHGSILFV